MSHDAFGNPNDPRDERPAPAMPVADAHPGAVQGTNPRAITALVLGLGGLFILPVILSIPAIVFGRRARREIDAGQGTGRGLATAGLVLGWVVTLLTVLVLILVVVAGVALFGGGDGSTSP